MPEPKYVHEPQPTPLFYSEPEFRPSPAPPVAPPRQPIRETIADASPFQRDDSLNDALGKKKPGHDIASSITDTPVSDIWSAITINERFLFVRELFANDAEGFKKTVTYLNSLDSWISAKNHLEDRFRWKQGDPAAADFLNIVRRRFL